MHCLGENIFGECDVIDERDAPKSLAAVGAGETFSIGVTHDGDVAGWGSAFYREFGDGDDTLFRDGIPRPPVAIRLPVRCRSVACGLHHVLALSVEGEVYAWGHNATGQTAQAPQDRVGSSRPAKVPFPTTNDSRFVALAAGAGHSLALQATGHVWSWGDNSNGQLGIGTACPVESTPQRVVFPDQTVVKSIAAGYAHSAALASDGAVWTFGWGLYHQLGHGSTTDSQLPTVVDALDGIGGGMIAVACGTWHTAAISSQGDVYTWGWGPDGQLGPSQPTSARVPAVVDTEDEYFSHESDGHHAVHIACGARFTIVVSRAGRVFSWGRLRASSTISAEQKIQGQEVVSIVAGHSHALILTTNAEQTS